MKAGSLIKFSLGLIFILSLSVLGNLSQVQAANSSDIVINEVQYDTVQTSTDTAYEWLELYNNTESSITLSGWTISDASSADVIPDLVMEPHGMAIVAATSNFADNYDPTGLNIVYLTGSIGNGLSNGGDQLILKDNRGQLIDQISYGTNKNILNPSIPGVGPGHSIERCPAGRDTDTASDFIDESEPTPGQGVLPNQPPVAEAGSNQSITLGQTVNFSPAGSHDPDGQITSYYWDFGDGEDSDETSPAHIYNGIGQFTATLTVTDDNNATSSDQVIINIGWPAYSSDIILNELLPNPSGDESTDEYIEIYNRGQSSIDLASWKIGDKSGSYYIINNKDFSSTIIPANGYFVIYRPISGIALNNSGGESVYLFSPDGQQKDATSYSGSVDKDYSYSRVGQDWQWSISPTPGSTNTIIVEEDDSGSSAKSTKTKSPSTKAKSTSGSSAEGSVLGIKKANAQISDPSSYHFSDAINKESLTPQKRWQIIAWILMIGAFLSLVIFRFILWRKDRYGPSIK